MTIISNYCLRNVAVQTALQLWHENQPDENELFHSAVQMLYRRLDFCRRKNVRVPSYMVLKTYGDETGTISQLPHEEILRRIKEIDEILFG